MTSWMMCRDVSTPYVLILGELSGVYGRNAGTEQCMHTDSGSGSFHDCGHSGPLRSLTVWARLVFLSKLKGV